MDSENKGSHSKGACSCGEVEFTLLQAPMFIHCCHCTWCQKETGSAFALNALIETSSINLDGGKLTRITVPTNSGKGQIIVRCSKCLSALWSHYGAAEEKVAFLRVGTLNNSREIQPDIHIYTSSKVNWLKLGYDTPVVEEYYRRSQYWPESSINRYKSAVQA